MRKLYQFALSFISVVCLCGLLIGCGNSSNPETAKVSGSVTMNGAPVTEGRVMFIPQGVKGDKAGKSGIGLLDKEGNFTMGTYSTKDGAVIGEHKVSVISLPGNGEVKAIGVADPEVVTVKAGESNTFLIDILPAKAGKGKAPGKQEDVGEDDED